MSNFSTPELDLAEDVSCPPLLDVSCSSDHFEYGREEWHPTICNGGCDFFSTAAGEAHIVKALEGAGDGELTHYWRGGLKGGGLPYGPFDLWEYLPREYPVYYMRREIHSCTVSGWRVTFNRSSVRYQGFGGTCTVEWVLIHPAKSDFVTASEFLAAQ